METSSPNSNSKTHAIYLTIIALLIAALVYSNLRLKQSSDKVGTVTEEKDEKATLLTKLQQEFELAKQELEQYKGQTASLDSMLSIRDNELEEKRRYIQSIISSGTASKNDLAKAQQMISDLKTERTIFQQRVDSLIAVNNKLQYEKIVLSGQRDSLGVELSTQKTTNEQISAENTNMKQKINKASILTAQNVTGSGIRYKKGKELTTAKSGDADKLKICFDLLENKIAEQGETDLAVRLLGPDGVTIQYSALGSGTFQDANSGNEIPYTYKIRPIYTNQQKNVCSLWDQDNGFPKGAYKAQIYQQGYMIGETSFSMK